MVVPPTYLSRQKCNHQETFRLVVWNNDLNRPVFLVCTGPSLDRYLKQVGTRLEFQYISYICYTYKNSKPVGPVVCQYQSVPTSIYQSDIGSVHRFGPVFWIFLLVYGTWYSKKLLLWAKISFTNVLLGILQKIIERRQLC